MRLIMKLADNLDQHSLAARMRQRRFQLFKSLLEKVPRPMKILDIGGTQAFWESMSFENERSINVTLLNLRFVKVKYKNFSSVIGDAKSMPEFSDQSFDVVFSNSVIEHVGGFVQQRQMAQEVQRIGKRYFIQTPNYWFPIEPHFLLPGFQWLPVFMRIFLVRKFNLGWMVRAVDEKSARELVEGIRLLKRREIEKLFPTAEIYEEKYLGLTKSFVAYAGW